MKDTSVKSSPALPLPLKLKPGPKKMAAKKVKEHKTPIMKVGRGKKGSKAGKKSKLNKDNLVPPVKRKRGRPRNEDRLHIKKPVKEQKTAKKDGRTVGRKRKRNIDAILDPEFIAATLKKPKMSDSTCNMNGDIKMPITAVGKPFLQKSDSPSVDFSSSNVINSNGTLHNKVFGHKKSPFTVLKSATFHPPSPKKEMLNGNGTLTPFKFQSNKNKGLFKKNLDINSLCKEMELNSKLEKFNTFSFPSNESKELNGNDLSNSHAKDFKLCSKESSKSQSKDLSKSLVKDPSKVQTKESTKTTVKDYNKAQPKDQSKPHLKESSKYNSKEPAIREPIKFNLKEPTLKEPFQFSSKEPFKNNLKEPNKPQTKEVKFQIKEPVKAQPKDTNKSTPKEQPPFIKSHPIRMASLDAMARMHVICTTDRKPPEPKHTSVAVCSPPRSFSHQKSITQCHERIQVDVKKETNEFKGNIVHKQEINVVKEKQQVFVSHSVEQSAIVEHEQSKTVSTKVQLDKEKKKKLKAADKSITDSKKVIKNKVKQSPSSKLKKLIGKVPKLEKNKPKVNKVKDSDKKIAKVKNKSVCKVTKSMKEKPEAKTSCKKSKKVEQTKSEVKVKETIRMQKTCTYQSVTTVNSHTANSSVVPVSHVGMTTNFSKTKKTVVTDEECKNNVNYSSGSVINNSYCMTTESPCSVSPHTDCCKFHGHPQIIPVAHVQTCSLGHSLNRTSDTSPSSSHCDGSFPMHRFGHQQACIFPPPPPPPHECGKF